MKFVPWKDRKKVAAGLKAVYGADTLELAEAVFVNIVVTI